jgi:hypothetical protein
LPFAFYRVTRRLEIDLEDVERLLAEHNRPVILVIHYFGRVDPGYQDLLEAARNGDADVIEDEAHALLTDLVGCASGRGGKHAIVSFHKLLPVSGGAWIVNGASELNGVSGGSPLQSYDLAAIAAARVRNQARLEELLSPLAEHVELLWSRFPAGQVPQTLPVLLRHAERGRAFRDDVYRRMNERGFGVVSLYPR